MSNLEPHSAKKSDQVNEERTVPKKFEHKGSMLVRRGLPIWELNMETGDIQEAEFMSTDATFNGGIKKKLVAKSDCSYIQALNIKNATKKFKRHFPEIFNK